MIAYLSPGKREAHSGGIRKLYDHVDILNEAGESAEIVFVPVGEPARSIEERLPRKTELLVVPEVYGDLLRTLSPGMPRLSLNQNAHFSWQQVADPLRHPYTTTPELLAVLCVSEHNRQLLQFAFPNVSVERFHTSVGARFTLGSFPRPRQICLFARKKLDRAQMVVGTLSSRGTFKGWKLVQMDGMADEDVAQTMRTSAILLSFSETEGFPGPPMEALASGCVVVGFTGGGGGEVAALAGPAFLAVPEDDILGFARVLESVMGRIESFRPACEEAASRLVKDYSREREIADVIKLIGHRLAVA